MVLRRIVLGEAVKQPHVREMTILRYFTEQVVTKAEEIVS
jgi:hypothetical protein